MHDKRAVVGLNAASAARTSHPPARNAASANTLSLPPLKERMTGLGTSDNLHGRLSGNEAEVTPPPGPYPRPRSALCRGAWARAQ